MFVLKKEGKGGDHDIDINIIREKMLHQKLSRDKICVLYILKCYRYKIKKVIPGPPTFLLLSRDLKRKCLRGKACS